MQWIPVAKRIPIDLSFLAGYSQLNSTFNFYDDKIGLFMSKPLQLQ